MIEIGQDLALADESLDHLGLDRIDLDQLDSGAHAKRAIGSLGQPDRAHPAFAQLANESPSAQLHGLGSSGLASLDSRNISVAVERGGKAERLALVLARGGHELSVSWRVIDVGGWPEICTVGS